MRLIWLRKAEVVVEDDTPPTLNDGEVELDKFNLRECWDAYKKEIGKADHIRAFKPDGDSEQEIRIWLIEKGEDPDWMKKSPFYREGDKKVDASDAASRDFFDKEIVPLLKRGYKITVANGAKILTMFDADGVHI